MVFFNTVETNERTNERYGTPEGKERLVEVANSPLTENKAVKNECELRGMQAAHLRDGAAMACFMSWLAETVSEGKANVSEVEIDEVSALLGSNKQTKRKAGGNQNK